MQPPRFEPPPVVYVAPKPRHELFHALKRLWAGLMLRKAAKLDGSRSSPEAAGRNGSE